MKRRHRAVNPAAIAPPFLVLALFVGVAAPFPASLFLGVALAGLFVLACQL